MLRLRDIPNYHLFYLASRVFIKLFSENDLDFEASTNTNTLRYQLGSEFL